jgi:Flp pilus assembly protein TadD
MHLEAGDLEEASRLVDAVLRERPRDIAALNLSAAIHVRRGERGAAVVALRRSLSLKPAQPEVERQLHELLTAAAGPAPE